MFTSQLWGGVSKAIRGVAGTHWQASLAGLASCRQVRVLVPKRRRRQFLRNDPEIVLLPPEFLTRAGSWMLYMNGPLLLFSPVLQTLSYTIPFNFHKVFWHGLAWTAEAQRNSVHSPGEWVK